MKIGTTTFGFRYSFLDPANSPTLAEIIRQTRLAGVERLQVCENVRPLEISKTEWREAMRCATDLGVELQLGCKTLRAEVVEGYIGLARDMSCHQLRIVMEDHDEHASRDSVGRLLEAIVPKLQAAGMRLAIENHFDIASQVLFELASAYRPEVVGFCVDTANSLRSIESPASVLTLLRDRAYCYHLKDYRIEGSLIGFSILGAPLGEGNLNLGDCLRLIFEKKPVPPLFVETWTPSRNDRERDIELEAEWLNRSVRNLRGLLPDDAGQEA
jgi:sugar phosphate isomerase/epimerase